MEDNEILQQIRRVREERARECHYDVHVMFERLRTETERLKAEGWQVVAPGPRAAVEADGVVREDPPNP